MRLASGAGGRVGCRWPIGIEGIGGGCLALYLVSNVGGPTGYLELVAKRPGTFLGMSGREVKTGAEI